MAGYMSERLQKVQEQNQNRGRLLINCPDAPGIVATVSKFLFQHGANIIESSQYSTNPQNGIFFMRIVFECPNLKIKASEIEHTFTEIAKKFTMEWKFTYAYEIKRTAIFVSKELHCLRELLWSWQSGDLLTDIGFIISNHEDAREEAKILHIPFYYIPANKNNRAEAEKLHVQLLDKYEIDLIILARYMQILTPNFVEKYSSKIINIHHSFLPAFVGAKPYERAYQRGVKLIGATSHYVTNDLDEGPIIEQDIHRVDHQDNVEDLKEIGRTVERSVLRRAVKWHLEDRIIVHGNKTIVF